MAKNTEKIWFGQLERFGYTLTAVGRSEKEVRKALEKEYVRVFKDENGVHPKDDFWDDGESYYDVAMREMYVDAFVPGSVEWL